MMKKNQRRALAVVTTLCLPATAWATNGYWAGGYGPKSKSIAGACVAMRFGAMCAASNPGSLAFVGDRLELGAAIFAPSRGFTADDNASPIGPPMGPASISPGKYESDNEYFLIPHLGYNKMLDANSSIGVAIGANGGMNTEYNSAVFQNFGNPMMPSTMATSPTGIDLMQMFIGITYSRKLNPQHGIGITPIIALQTFEAEGLEPFTPYSKHPEHVTGNGRDFSYGMGLRIGWSGEVTEGLVLGASYQSQMWMSDFEDYKGLFAEEGNFDIPPNYDLGLAYQFSPGWTFAFNYQRIEFSSINAIGNASDLAFIPGQTLLGTDDGLGFGWEDMNIFKFGLQWKYSPQWTFRTGYSIADDAFPNTQALFNILAPAVVTEHYALGFGYQLHNDSEINLAFTYMPNNKVHGQNPNTGPQTGNVEMDQWELEIGWAMRF